MNRRKTPFWIALSLLLFSMLTAACADSPACTSDSECAPAHYCAQGGGVFFSSAQCVKRSHPTAPDDTDVLNDTDTQDANHDTNPPNDADTNNTDAGTNNTDAGTNPPIPAFSGCTSNHQCASHQTCNTARGRCEDARQSCTSTDECIEGVHCNAGVCTAQCEETSDCIDSFECIQTDTIKLCLATCTDFSPTSTDCPPDTHCIPSFGASGGICTGTGRKNHGDHCLPDGDPDSCQPGHTCITQGGQRTCQKLCTLENTTCSPDSYCEPTFFGPDPNILTDDAGICLTDCKNTENLPDSALCPSGYTCTPSSHTDHAFCTIDTEGGLDSPCLFNQSNNGCNTGLACLASGYGAITGEPETGVCTNLCKRNQNPTGCNAGYICAERTNAESPEDGVCIKTCHPHLPASTNLCPSGRNRCIPNVSETDPEIPGICALSSDIEHEQTCPLQHFQACNADDICANLSISQGNATGQTEGTCTTFCPAFDYTNPSRCPAHQVCGIFSFSNHLGFCTPLRPTNGQNVGERCDENPQNQGKWCDDNILCDGWNGQFLTCEIPCFTNHPNACPPGNSCDSVNNTTNPNLGYCR